MPLTNQELNEVLSEATGTPVTVHRNRTVVKLGKSTLIGAALDDVESPAEAVERLSNAAAIAELPLDFKAPPAAGKAKPKGKAKKDQEPETETPPAEVTGEDFEAVLDEYEDLGFEDDPFDEPDDLD